MAILSVSNYTNGENLSQTVLNRPIDEIVDYINNQKNLQYVTSAGEIDVTVGNSGADFSSLQDAINYMARFQPVFSPSATDWNTGSSKLPGRILIKSGFVIEESILCIGTNLGWVSIESEDSTVYIDPFAVQHYSHAGSSDKVGFFGSTSFMPAIRCSLQSTNMTINNFTMVWLSNGSQVNLGGVGPSRNLSYMGSTGTGSYAVRSVTGSYVWLDGQETNRIEAGISADISILDGSFSYLSVYNGGRAVITGSTGVKDTSIPTNTLTPHGIIFEA